MMLDCIIYFVNFVMFTFTSAMAAEMYFEDAWSGLNDLEKVWLNQLHHALV